MATGFTLVGVDGHVEGSRLAITKPSIIGGSLAKHGGHRACFS